VVNEELDIHGAGGLFSDEVTTVKDGNGQMQLIMRPPFSSSDLYL
jgi:hypothetical protein